MSGEGLKIGGLWAEIGLDTTPLAAAQAQVKTIVNSLDPLFGSLNNKVAGLNTEFVAMGAMKSLGGLGSSMKAQTVQARQALNGFSSDFVSVQSTMAASAQAAAQDAERAIVASEARKAAAFNNTIGIMKNAAAGFGIYFGAQQAIRFGREAIALAADEEMAVHRLKNQVMAMGGSWNESEKPMQTWFSQLQETTRYMRDDTSEAFRLLLTKTGDYNKAVIDLPAVLGLAASGLTDLNGASDAAAKAESGQTRQLAALIPMLRSSKDVMGDFRKMYSGRAGEDLDTYSGKIDHLNNTFRSMKEVVGKDLIDNLTPFTNLMERLSNIGKTEVNDKSIIGRMFGGFVKYSVGGGLPYVPIRAAVKFANEAGEWAGVGNKRTKVTPPPLKPVDEWAKYYMSDEDRTQYGMEPEKDDYAKRRVARETMFSEGISSLAKADSDLKSLHSSIAAGWKDLLASTSASEMGMEAVWTRYADAQRRVIADQKQSDLELGMSSDDAEAFAKKKLDDLDAEHAAFIRNAPLIDAQVTLYKDLATSGFLSATDLKTAWSDYTVSRLRQINDEANALGKIRGMTPEDVNRFKKGKTIGLVDEQKQYYAGLKDSVAGSLRDVLQENNLSRDKMQAIWTDYEDLRKGQIDEEVARMKSAAAEIGITIDASAIRESMEKGLKDEKLDLVGTEMQKWSGGTAQRMRDTFSELFFDAQKGDWKSWQNYVENLSDSLMRAISDDVGKMVADWIMGMDKMKSSTGGTLGSILSWIGGIVGGGSPAGTSYEELPTAASGGITKGLTLAGEIPEAIIPLSKFRDPAFMAAITGRAATGGERKIVAQIHVHGVTNPQAFIDSETQILSTFYSRMAAADARNS